MVGRGVPIDGVPHGIVGVMPTSLSGLLFGVTVTTITPYLLVAALLLVVAVIACLAPLAGRCGSIRRSRSVENDLEPVITP